MIYMLPSHLEAIKKEENCAFVCMCECCLYISLPYRLLSTFFPQNVRVSTEYRMYSVKKLSIGFCKLTSVLVSASKQKLNSRNHSTYLQFGYRLGHSKRAIEG